ncbi:MAG: NAD(P)/FAD-dependent oxidoreductase [Geminicoccaceae bacterium]|nr:MAG: NAD(P)/FAD-dependent oxidoreductase [Geminicoccaceae bacterium]
MDRVQTVVVGAGVVGLAVARALAQTGREVMVLEKEGAIGTETSSRNSEVIHAGIYYPTGSLKALTCVAGKQRLYDYCRERHVHHANCGKLIVATDESQHATLRNIQAKAKENGVELEWWEAERARALEPELACTAALWSSTTGIVDSHAFMLALEGDLGGAGGLVVFHAPVEAATATGDGFVLRVGGDAPMELLADELVNCAGLHAPRLAARIQGLALPYVPAGYYCKGNYFTLSGRSPFARLIYPVPEAAGLGVHVTIDLAGQARFGPDTEWVDELDYDVHASRADVFYAAVRKYWPALPDDALQPGYAGIRPKLAPAGAPTEDFRIEGPAVHGLKGLVNMFGIESPGLTASLALADLVVERLAA